MSLDTFKKRMADNVPGKIYVSDQCVDCDYCRAIAPENFARNNEGGYSYVKKQPETPEEWAGCSWAIEGCCTETIFDDGDGFDWTAIPAPTPYHLTPEGQAQRARWREYDHRADRWPQNVRGKYYVDGRCGDCDLCRHTAPRNFSRHDPGCHSFVFKQPDCGHDLRDFLLIVNIGSRARAPGQPVPRRRAATASQLSRGIAGESWLAALDDFRNWLIREAA